MSRLVSSTRARVLTVAVSSAAVARVTAGQWTPAAVTLSYKWVGLRLAVKVVAKADGYLKSVLVTKRSVTIASG